MGGEEEAMDPKELGKKDKNNPPVSETDPLPPDVPSGENNCGDQDDSDCEDPIAWKRKFDEFVECVGNAITAAKKVRKIEKKNRCNVCRKKLPLTAIVCRCGNKFCGIHRYSDRHGCSFDYKTHGAEQLRKDNPRIIAKKIRRI